MGATKILGGGGQKVTITDESIGVSQILGTHARATSQSLRPMHINSPLQINKHANDIRQLFNHPSSNLLTSNKEDITHDCNSSRPSCESSRQFVISYTIV